VTDPDAAPPEPEIVQWGAGLPVGRLRFGRLAGWGRQEPRLGWLLAGGGGLALFGSLLDTWQVTPLPEEITGGDFDPVIAELSWLGVWGTVWAFGVVLLATCGALAVRGLPSLRAPARSTGLALAGVLLALLVAISIDLERSSVLAASQIFPETGLEPELGRAVYLGYAGLALVAAGLWRIRPPVAAIAGPVAGPAAGPVAGPRDLAVGPAEPFLAPRLDDQP
jgi:hypothetical protein